MEMVSGNPRLGTIDDLLAQPVILSRPGRIRSECEDRLFVGRALLEANAFSDDRLEYFAAEHLLNLRADVAGQRRPLVVHRDHDPENSERGVRTSAHLLD